METLINRIWEKRFIYLYILLFFGLPKQSYSQFSNETGLFPIVNFVPEDYKNYSPQNWAIVQDNRGIMYFGNNEGVLEYDGIKWRMYKVANETSVTSLCVDQNGRIYIGANGEIGYLAPNNLGDLSYVSLLEYLNDSIEFNEVWYAFSFEYGIVFQTRNYIFLWDGIEIKTWEAPSTFHTSFQIHNNLILKDSKNGLFLFKDDMLVKVSKSEFFNDKSIFAMLEHAEDQILVVTGRNGLYKIRLDVDKPEINNIEKIEGTDKILSQYQLYNAIKIADKTYSLGTWGKGLLIFQNGKIIQLITKKSGLSNEIIYNQFFDKDQNLWLALSFGITKIEINSPLSRFEESLGIEGTIETVCRFNDRIYLATDRGLLHLPDNWSRTDKVFDQQKFVKMDNFQTGCWDILNFNEKDNSHLIIATDDAIVKMTKDQNTEVIKNCAPWKLYQSECDANLIYVGLDDGLNSYVLKNGSWELKNDFPEISETIFNFSEDSTGKLWCGTFNQGIIAVEYSKIKNKEVQVNRYNVLNGLPENSPVYTANFEGTVYFGTDEGIYIYENDTFIKAKDFPDLLIDGSRLIHRLKSDGSGKLWAVIFTKNDQIEIGYLQKQDDKYIWNATPFNTISQGIIHSFFFDNENVIWLGGTEGLYRYDSKVKKEYAKDFVSLIRLNIVGIDSTVFFGSYFNEKGYITTIQPEVLKPTLKYKYNSLSFNFAAQNTEIEHPVQFSYFLEGFDKGWSSWSENPERYYTNLYEGNYVFKVKAKNIYNHESELAAYEFKILPPWYRTIVAYIGYLIALVALIFIIVTQYTKYLRAIIKERTKEIRHQKEIVEEKNEHIMDSIRYAKRIQDALLPPEEILNEALKDHFILFKPRDIVSGDFYWFRQVGEYVLVIAADCTGHGVPGAFVSMLGMAFLNEITLKIKEYKADVILNMLREQVIKSLRQTGKEGESKDGMDIALCIIDRKNFKLQFAGANNPLFIVRQNELIAVKADRMPIGHYIKMDEFQNNEMDIQEGDMLYSFSDGYQDQFGGENGQKFKTKSLKELLTRISNEPVHIQKKILDETIEAWKGEEEQVDDILLIGIRI